MAATKYTGRLMEMSTRFQGKYPEVPLAPDISIDELTEGDASPFFVTLPVGRVGAQSRNDRKYPREAVEAIQNAIVNDKVGGILGHMRDEDLPYRFDLPVMHWVGATLEGDTLYGKAYIPPSQQELREYLKIQMKKGAKTGTSIFGTAYIEDDGTVRDLEIQTIDLAHASRVGVPMTAALPMITSETEKSEVEISDQPIEESETMDAEKKLNAEAAPVEPAVIIEMKRSHAEAVRELNAKLLEAQAEASDLNKVREMLGKPTDVILALQTLQRDKASLAKENLELLQGAIKLSVEEAVKVPAARPIVEAAVKAEKPTRASEVKQVLEAVLGRTEMVELLKLEVREAMGPEQTRPQTPVKPEDKRDANPDFVIHIPGMD
jgi:hypothetical protein